MHTPRSALKCRMAPSSIPYRYGERWRSRSTARPRPCVARLMRRSVRAPSAPRFLESPIFDAFASPKRQASGYALNLICHTRARRRLLRGEEGDEVGEAISSTVGRLSQLFGGQVHPVDPKGFIAKGSRSGRVPAGEGRKQDFFAFQPKGIDRHAIGARCGFIALDRIGTEAVLEETVEMSVANARFEHARREIRKECKTKPCFFQRPQCRDSIWPGRKLQVGLHQPLATLSRQIDLQGLRGIDERVFRHLPEICVTLSDRAQPHVFKLADAPGLAQHTALARKKLLCESEDRARIEDRKSIKG